MMCQLDGSLMTVLEYQKTWPQEPGDYLWIRQWGCGCVLESGLCWIQEHNKWYDEQGVKKFMFSNDDGDLFDIHWEGDGPPRGWNPNEDLYIDWWAKIDLPPGKDQ